jgi:hypothetical protein
MNRDPGIQPDSVLIKKRWSARLVHVGIQRDSFRSEPRIEGYFGARACRSYKVGR